MQALEMIKSVIRGGDRFASAFVSYQGLRLPPPSSRFCTEDWKNDAFYVSSAKAEVERLVSLAQLDEQSKLLDIGCGQGRLAIGLAAKLPKIDLYCGIDVSRRSIEWCNRNLAAFHSNFRFLHLDIQNERYNPHGIPFEPPVQLPLADDSFDVAFLYSVFTHMRSRDVESYLRDIGRVLRPGGRAFFTVYVEEDCAPEAENPPSYLEDLGASTGALHRVLFERAFFESMIRSAGLQIGGFYYRSEGVTKQSAYLLVKPAASVH
jgi:SAM-dependent methyltransferase